MLLAPVILSIVLFVLVQKMEWSNDMLVVGACAIWATYFGIMLNDFIGSSLGWWSTTVNL